MPPTAPTTTSPTRPLSIGYVTRSFPVLFQATVFNEIRFLQRAGHRVEIFSLLDVREEERRLDGIEDLPAATYCWRDRQTRAQVLGATARILRSVGIERVRDAYAFAKEAALLTDLRAFLRLAAWADILRSRGVRHFHAHWATEATTLAMIFSWLSGLRFSFTAHAYDIFFQPQLLDRKLREAAFTVTVSAYNKRFLQEQYGEALASKIHVIYPFIDLSVFPERAPSAVPADGSITIVSVGRLTEYKGFIHLVEACRLLKARHVPFTCRIAGLGEDEAPLRDAIARHGLSGEVQLLGAVPFARIPSLLEQATVFCLPCVIARNGDRDGMPLVLIEAMARGLPVVSSDVIGLRELVRDGAGLTVPPGDPAALAEALERVGALGRNERIEMGRRGRAIIESEFDAGQAAHRLAGLFATSLDDQPMERH